MLTDKKFTSIQKILGSDRTTALDALSPNELKAVITNADMAMKQALDQLEANPKYQEIKDSLKAIREGVTELRKNSNAVVTYALHLLEEKGQ